MIDLDGRSYILADDMKLEAIEHWLASKGNEEVLHWTIRDLPAECAHLFDNKYVIDAFTSSTVVAVRRSDLLYIGSVKLNKGLE